MSTEDTAREVALLRDQLGELIAAGRLQVEHDGPGRVNLSEVVRGLLAAVTKTSPQHSAVTITRNARGGIQYEVTVRTGDSDDVVTVDDAAAKAVELEDRLALLYPLRSEPMRGATPAAREAESGGKA